MNDNVLSGSGEGVMPESRQRAVAARKPRPVATMQPAAATTPMDLLRIVTERGASVDEIGKFMDLMERQQANEARQAFVRAMAAFKRNPPDIYKDKDVGYAGKNESKTAYSHATLGNICEKVIAALAEHGISHNWVTSQPGGKVEVTCVLTHEQGHSTSTTIEAAPDTSGSKNAIQSIGSAITYLSRYTLLAACGIAVKDGSDDDGAATGLDPNAVKDAVKGKAPDKHNIGKKSLDDAIASIKVGDYDYESLVGYYALTPEQLAFVDTQLGRGAA